MPFAIVLLLNSYDTKTVDKPIYSPLKTNQIFRKKKKKLSRLMLFCLKSSLRVPQQDINGQFSIKEAENNN